MQLMTHRNMGRVINDIAQVVITINQQRIDYKHTSRFMNTSKQIDTDTKFFVMP